MAPKVSSKMQERRMKLAWHIWRHNDLVAHSVLFWDPKHSYRSPGRPKKTYFDTLCDDTGLRDAAEMQRLI